MSQRENSSTASSAAQAGDSPIQISALREAVDELKKELKQSKDAAAASLSEQAHTEEKRQSVASAAASPATDPKIHDTKAELKAAELELDEAAKKRLADLESKVARLRSVAARETQTGIGLSLIQVSQKHTTDEEEEGEALAGNVRSGAIRPRAASHTSSQDVAQRGALLAKAAQDPNSQSPCTVPRNPNSKMNLEPYLDCLGSTCRSADPIVLKALLGKQVAVGCEALVKTYTCDYDLSQGSDLPDGTLLAFLCAESCPDHCSYFVRQRQASDQAGAQAVEPL
jgi:hypothetical protein